MNSNQEFIYAALGLSAFLVLLITLAGKSKKQVTRPKRIIKKTN